MSTTKGKRAIRHRVSKQSNTMMGLLGLFIASTNLRSCRTNQVRFTSPADGFATRWNSGCQKQKREKKTQFLLSSFPGSVRVAEKLKQEAWLEADESTQRESYDVAQQPKKEQSQQKEAQKYRRGNKRKAETQSEEVCCSLSLCVCLFSCVIDYERSICPTNECAG